MGRWTCRLAIEYFGVIGTALEALNVRLSRHIECGVGAREDLDSSLVTIEQLEVEQLIRQHGGQRSHCRAIEQINRPLHWAHQLARPLRHCPSIRVYGHVLGHLRARLGRPANFVMLEDRIGIGHALTGMIRELGPQHDSVNSYTGCLDPWIFRGLVQV